MKEPWKKHKFAILLQYQYMMIYQVSLFGKVGVHGYNQVKKHKTNVTLHSRFSEWVYFFMDGVQYNLGATDPLKILQYVMS